MIKIGVTGGICSGKSTVCKFIESLGYDVFYSDIEANRMILTMKDEIIKHFGSESFIGEVYNSSYMRELVFSDSSKLELLNSLFKDNIKGLFDEFCIGKDIIFYESALIYEHNIEDQFDYIIGVYCDPITVISRLKARNNFDDIMIGKILNVQISPSKIACGASDWVINTSNKFSLSKINEILKFIHNGNN